MKDTDLLKVMTVPESEAWKSFVFVIENFLVNHNSRSKYVEVSSYTISIWINFRII